MVLCATSPPLSWNCFRVHRQLARAAAPVNIFCVVRAEPKSSASFTHFQLNAQILHHFSKARQAHRRALSPASRASRLARSQLAALLRPLLGLPAACLRSAFAYALWQ